MTELLTSLLAGGVSGTIVAFLLKTWVEARVRGSIEHEYDRRLELFKRQLDERQKIGILSELLAEWISFPKEEQISDERRKVFNRLSFEATLWLPPKLAVELSKRLQNKSDAKNIFEILLLAREQLTGDTSLRTEHVTFWKPEFEKRGEP